LLSGACSANPIMIRANTPISLQRFHRLYSVFGGPYSAGASHHRRRGVARSHLETSFDISSGHMARTGAHPIAINKNNSAQNTPVIHASATSALWKVRSKPLHLRLRQPIKIAHHIPLKLGVVNHDNAITSIS
jgi:hypothetical protein